MATGELKIDACDALSFLANGAPLLDVRSPGEYSVAKLPNTLNCPILLNAERDAVGTTYKKDGPHRAQELGHWLVCGETRQRRVASWIKIANAHHPCALFCARGGLRSQLAQQWLLENGTALPRVSGGYKALRKILLQHLNPHALGIRMILLTGKTGCGKTSILHELAPIIPVLDLEGLANHKGSAFGGVYGQQPAQAAFENALAIALLRHKADQQSLLVEDESRMVGRIELPDSFFEAMKVATRIELVRPVEERVDILLEEYISFQLEAFTQYSNFEFLGSVSPFQMLRRALVINLSKIQKKLGGVRHGEMKKMVELACLEHEHYANIDVHKKWMEMLLVWYYDPLYEKHLQKIRPLITDTIHPDELAELLPRLSEIRTARPLLTGNA